jgi:hypothetical protein
MRRVKSYTEWFCEKHGCDRVHWNRLVKSGVYFDELLEKWMEDVAEYLDYLAHAMGEGLTTDDTDEHR